MRDANDAAGSLTEYIEALEELGYKMPVDGSKPLKIEGGEW